MTSRPTLLIFTLALVTTTSCAMPWTDVNTRLRASGTFVESMDVDTTAPGGATTTADSEYESIEVGFGSLASQDGEKKWLREMFVAKSSVREVDAYEIGAGGRFFLGNYSGFEPFLGLHAVVSIYDELAGTNSAGTQFGVRLGAGTEYALNDWIFLDAGLHYLVPISGSSFSYTGIGAVDDTEVGGLSLGVGIGIDF
ncbi:MAG: hypothetical protein ACPG31_00805 [Planctomycetota bacterium]